MRGAARLVRRRPLAVLLALGLSLGLAAGAARGGTGQSPATSLVALGDSVATGTACACPPFPDLAAHRLAPGTRVRNLARDGETTSGLLTQLQTPASRAALGAAAAVTVTVGANDFDESLADQARCVDPDACFAAPLSELEPTLTDVLLRTRELAPAGVPVVVTGYWSVFRAGAVARAHGPQYVASAAALTRRVDAALAAAATAASACFVDLSGPFAQDGDVTALLAPDGDHPDAQGQRVIAEAVAQTLQHQPGAQPGPGHPCRTG